MGSFLVALGCGLGGGDVRPRNFLKFRNLMRAKYFLINIVFCAIAPPPLIFDHGKVRPTAFLPTRTTLQSVLTLRSLRTALPNQAVMLDRHSQTGENGDN